MVGTVFSFEKFGRHMVLEKLSVISHLTVCFCKCMAIKLGLKRWEVAWAFSRLPNENQIGLAGGNLKVGLNAHFLYYLLFRLMFQ